jgi:hypothetical protein
MSAIELPNTALTARAAELFPDPDGPRKTIKFDIFVYFQKVYESL